MRAVTRLFARGELAPLPYRAFDASETVEAFRLMQNSSHVGKLVVRPPRLDDIVGRQRHSFQVAADKLHLITGGFGGFGLETARWLAAKGARNIMLVGRSGPGQRRGGCRIGIPGVAGCSGSLGNGGCRRTGAARQAVRSLRQGVAGARRRDPCGHGPRRRDDQQSVGGESRTRVAAEDRRRRQPRPTHAGTEARLFRDVFVGNDADRQSRPGPPMSPPTVISKASPGAAAALACRPLPSHGARSRMSVFSRGATPPVTRWQAALASRA